MDFKIFIKKIRTSIVIGLIPLLVVLLSYCLYWFSDEFVISNTLRKYHVYYYKNDSYQLVEKVYQDYCDENRHYFCMVELRDKTSRTTIRIPQIKKNSYAIRLLEKNKIVKMDLFIDDVELVFSSLPAFSYFLLLSIVSGLVLGSIIIFFKYFRSRRELKLSNENLKLTSELNSIYVQVAHDIRSPLAVLKEALSSESNVSKDSRDMISISIERINDIANDLLLKSKTFLPVGKNITNYYLLAVLDEIVSEKRIEYRSYSGLSIHFLNRDCYQIFSRFNCSDFKVLMSNLINNSVEALNDFNGEIFVNLYSQDGMAFIEVQDNGKGIDPDTLKILGKQKVSHGKTVLKSGHGLGLYHAANVLNKLGGNINFESTVSVGTKVSITIPLSNVPSWFLKEINLHHVKSVIVFDNDPEMLNIWRSKLKGKHINLIFCHQKDELAKTLSEIKSNFMIMCDYDLGRIGLNGVDILEQLDVVNNAVLVTNHFHDEKVLERCSKINLKILPKIYMQHISFNDYANYNILIDDDKLTRMVWEKSATSFGINLVTFESVEQFKQSKFFIQQFMNAKIYIDSQLKNEVKGEEEALALFKIGFVDISLVTGLPAHVFKEMYWIKEIRSKSPPFKFE